MDSKNADLLIVKLIENNISEQESEWLTAWLQNEEHLDYFNSFIEINYLIQSKSTFDTQASEEQAKQRVKPKTRRHLPVVLKYAAAILVLLGSGYFLFFKTEISNSGAPTVIANNVKIGTDKATLTLEDGSQVVLNKGIAYRTAFAESDGEALVYQNENEQPYEIVYNVLTIPRGGQFFVQLSDGTKVWLNSESKLKYPKNFMDGQSRNVELVYGEAYFEVSPSTAHNGATFKVISKHQEIEVLGTQFNVKAYQEEATTYTTLVEGKIALKIASQRQLIKPNQQAIVDKTNKIVIHKVDVYNEISWKEGVFSFEDKSLKEIMAVLSRWYDMDVEFKNHDIEKVEFMGTLSKNQDIDDILTTIKSFGVIEDYKIKNKKVILK